MGSGDYVREVRLTLRQSQTLYGCLYKLVKIYKDTSQRVFVLVSNELLNSISAIIRTLMRGGRWEQVHTYIKGIDMIVDQEREKLT